MPARIESVAQAWDDYRAIVMPKNAGPTQVKECRRAFYAGAETLFAMTRLLEPAFIPDDAAYVANLHDELIAFAHDVQEGVA